MRISDFENSLWMKTFLMCKSPHTVASLPKEGCNNCMGGMTNPVPWTEILSEEAMAEYICLQGTF